jgi:AcrR family transcriptional regulator
MKGNSAEETHSERRIIAAAKALFHKQDVRSTHVDEILEAAEVSSKQFRHCFRTRYKFAGKVCRRRL